MKAVRIPLDTTATEGKDILLKLQDMVRADFLVAAETDLEKDHCRAVKIYEAPTAHERPLFDFGYTLRRIDDSYRLSWQENELSYEECLFLYTLTMMRKPVTVVESGMGLGISTVHVAQALKFLQKGTIFTVESDEAKIRRGYHMIDAFKLKEFTHVVSQQPAKFFAQWTRPIDMLVLNGTDVEEQYKLLKPHLKPDAYVVTRGSGLSDGGLSRFWFPSPQNIYVHWRVPEKNDGVGIPRRLEDLDPATLDFGEDREDDAGNNSITELQNECKGLAPRAKKSANCKRKPVRRSRRKGS